MSRHPRSGGRIWLELDVQDTAVVSYRVVLYTPSVAHAGAATIALADGQVAFAAWVPADPPLWLVAFAHAFLRGEWRARRAAAEPEPWPSRISRWREERTGSSLP